MKKFFILVLGNLVGNALYTFVIWPLLEHWYLAF